MSLALGDIIQIHAPDNSDLNDKIFLITYISNDTIKLVDELTLEDFALNVKDGALSDESIKKIIVLDRASTASYARQNKLTPGTWVDIYFGGTVPSVITGEITNLEEDMIEIITFPARDVIYIDFGYTGIPKELPIEKISIREPLDTGVKDVEPTTELEGEVSELEEDTVAIEPRMRLQEVIIDADNVDFGEVMGAITQTVEVAEHEKRFSLTMQVNDLLDELLSHIPTIDRTPAVLDQVHITVTRFKQLREAYSVFDQLGNALPVIFKTPNYKPILSVLEKLNRKLYWLLPIVKNKIKLYDKAYDDNDDADFEMLSLTGNDTGATGVLQEENADLDKYRNNRIPDNRYSYFANTISDYGTPFLHPDSLSGTLGVRPVLTNINVVVDNLGDFNSSVVRAGSEQAGVKSHQYLIEKYITGLNKLTKEADKHMRLTEITSSNRAYIRGFLFLPGAYVRYSQIELPGTDILQKSKLNEIGLDYWQFLQSGLTVPVRVLDSLSEEYKPAPFLKSPAAVTLSDSIVEEDRYERFLDAVMPTTREFFEMFKPSMNNPLSYHRVIQHLQPFMIYPSDIIFQQYVPIINFVGGNIALYKQAFATRQIDFNKFKNRKRYTKITSAIGSLVDKEVFGLYRLTSKMVTAEMLNQMLVSDYAQVFTTVATIGTEKLYSKTDIRQYMQSKLDEKRAEISEQLGDNSCRDFVLAKVYQDAMEMQEDADKDIYFDVGLDTTDYDIIKEYKQREMSDQEYLDYVTAKLMENVGLSEQKARYDARTMIDGRKRIVDGQYAVAEIYMADSSDVKLYYYTRRNNKWVYDPQMSQDAVTKDSTMFCDIREPCIKMKEECVQTPILTNSLQASLLDDITSNFSRELDVSKELLLRELQRRLLDGTHRLRRLLALETYAASQYDIARRKLGNEVMDRDETVSPYLNMMHAILAQPDFVTRQMDIIKFSSAYTIEGTDYFRLCITTNVPLLPTFLLRLANAHFSGTYSTTLDAVCKEQGTISDSGDSWVDEESGYFIRAIDYDVEEGYEATGYKIVTRNVLEEDLGNVVSRHTSPEARTISNVVQAVTQNMGVPISSQLDFIITGVLSLLTRQLPSKSDYERRVSRAAAKAKKMPAYDFVFNNLLLLATLAYLLVAVQTQTPSVRTRITFPGCVRSFKGYPTYDESDMQALTYIACVANKLKSSAVPWNTIKRMNEETLISKLKSLIDKHLLAEAEVGEKIRIKQEYVSALAEEEFIPNEHAVVRWSTFLPPLRAVSVGPIRGITGEFKSTLIDNVKAGNKSQDEELFVLRSKVLYYTLAIIQTIQRVINKEVVILKSNNQEPFLENVCCNLGERKTLKYFKDREPSIEQHDVASTMLMDMYNAINNATYALMLFDAVDSTFVYPALSLTFSEETIYGAFIYYCKYNRGLPLTESLRAVCNLNTSAYMMSDSLEEKIRTLKSEGRMYTYEGLLLLLDIVAREHMVDLNLDKQVINVRERMVGVLRCFEARGDCNSCIPVQLRKGLANLMDTYDLFYEERNEDVDALRDYLITENETMKGNIIRYLNEAGIFGSLRKQKIRTFFDTISEWSPQRGEGLLSGADETTLQVYEYIREAVVDVNEIFPEIVLHGVSYANTPVPAVWNLSERHKKDIQQLVYKGLQPLEKFYNQPILEAILRRVRVETTDIMKLAKSIPFLASSEKDSRVLKSVFNDEVVKDLAEFYLLFSFATYIRLAREVADELSAIPVSGTEQSELLEVEIASGEQLGVHQRVAELLEAYIQVLSKQKSTVNVNERDVMERVLRAKEKEKDEITTFLKDLTDEQREIENLFKNSKLGRWSKGQVKGVVEYVGAVYDQELVEIEQRAILENRAGNISEVTDMNRDIYALDIAAQDTRDELADAEANDMSELPNDDDFGERDGDERFY